MVEERARDNLKLIFFGVIHMTLRNRDWQNVFCSLSTGLPEPEHRLGTSCGRFDLLLRKTVRGNGHTAMRL